MNSKNLVFELNRCNNSAPNNNCASKQEIDKFVSKITVETWANYNKINFKIHDKLPLTRFEDWIRTDRIEIDKVITNNFQILHNNV